MKRPIVKPFPKGPGGIQKPPKPNLYGVTIGGRLPKKPGVGVPIPHVKRPRKVT